MTQAVTQVDVEAIQRRTVRPLVVAQAVGAVGITVGVATASLLARDLSGSEAQAGFVQSAQTLGAALFAFWLARVMALRGRRLGQVAGLLTGAAGALLAVVAGEVGSMALLLVGAILLGATTAANASARYAATDLAHPEHRARDLSTVVWATTIGAVLGPNLSGPSGVLARSVGVPELTGPFLVGGIMMLAAAGVVWAGMRPDPLLTARALADAGAAAEPAVGTRDVANASPRGALGVIVSDPLLLASVAAQACAHAAMVAVMIMTPLHMEHGGAHLDVIGFVISIHVLGMFAFSPLVGRACDRVGRGPVMAAGGVVLMASVVLSGASRAGMSWHISLGLFLLGLGWSMATVAASATIADRAPLERRTQVQGGSDMFMLLAAAGAGALSGPVVGEWGYSWLAYSTSVLAVGVVAAGVTIRTTRPE
ncbi:MFS transporter [Nocardioides seonyuensis]|uniref:MFS transporter n=1 Tax=Nocardioides seonyuensis TaxID=2518371 RepID=A0A4P7IL86_9ACTN|nr:MFS transporter [Nocardioides seonyuensis]QBX56831.1 MFS transporter [Nocardioides seonyuensis]